MSLALSSIAAFSASVQVATAIDLAAYTLRDGAVREALIAAARGGAEVRVRLERDPFDDSAGSLHRANADAVAALAAAGADAALTAPNEPPLHMKAAVVDGVAWLDDRNWADGRRETVLRDSDIDDVAVVSAALNDRPGDNGHLRTTKIGAQYLEADLIRASADGPVDVESESFGNGPVYSALLARARAGLPTQLLVAGREASQPGASGDAERARLAKLAGLGVEVRTGDPGRADFDEKLAVADHSAWVGSANATDAHGAAGAQRDWGLTTREPVVVDGLRAAFAANWRGARVFAGATPSGEPPSISASTSL